MRVPAWRRHCGFHVDVLQAAVVQAGDWFEVCSGRHAIGNELQCNYKWRCQRAMACSGYCKMHGYYQVHMLILHFCNSSTCMRISWATRIVIASIRWSLKCILPPFWKTWRLGQGLV
jgi:hypothetical protein